jgi:hypothetical protein
MKATAVLGILALIVSVLLISSCAVAPYKAYMGPDLPSDKTALIEGADPGINLVSCDGIKPTSRQAISVLPGEHTVEMSFNDPSVGYSRDTSLFKFTAEAGHRYAVDKTISSDPGRYFPFIMDKTTGRKIQQTFLAKPGTEEQRLAMAEKSIKQHPTNADFWIEKGAMLIELKRYEEAVSTLDTATSLNIYSAPAYSLKSQALFELKRYEEALAAIDKAINLRLTYSAYQHSKDAIIKAMDKKQ